MILKWFLKSFLASILKCWKEEKPGEKLEIIKPLTWVKVHLKKDNICGVLCDRYYEERDYIRDYKKFNEIKNRIKSH